MEGVGGGGQRWILVLFFLFVCHLGTARITINVPVVYMAPYKKTGTLVIKCVSETPYHQKEQCCISTPGR
jgi:hypothetical protein